VSIDDLANTLDIPGISARIPCTTGRDECRCDGCVASAALRLADEHLAAGRLFDAMLKAEHAAHYCPDVEVRMVAARLESALNAVTLRQAAFERAVLR
jgi:hypothetical protein